MSFPDFKFDETQTLDSQILRESPDDVFKQQFAIDYSAIMKDVLGVFPESILREYEGQLLQGMYNWSECSDFLGLPKRELITRYLISTKLLLFGRVLRANISDKNEHEIELNTFTQFAIELLDAQLKQDNISDTRIYSDIDKVVKNFLEESSEVTLKSKYGELYSINSSYLNLLLAAKSNQLEKAIQIFLKKDNLYPRALETLEKSNVVIITPLSSGPLLAAFLGVLIKDRALRFITVSLESTKPIKVEEDEQLLFIDDKVTESSPFNILGSTKDEIMKRVRVV